MQQKSHSCWTCMRIWCFPANTVRILLCRSHQTLWTHRPIQSTSRTIIWAEQPVSWKGINHPRPESVSPWAWWQPGMTAKICWTSGYYALSSLPQTLFRLRAVVHESMILSSKSETAVRKSSINTPRKHSNCLTSLETANILKKSLIMMKS